MPQPIHNLGINFIFLFHSAHCISVVTVYMFVNGSVSRPSLMCRDSKRFWYLCQNHGFLFTQRAMFFMLLRTLSVNCCTFVSFGRGFGFGPVVWFMSRNNDWLCTKHNGIANVSVDSNRNMGPTRFNSVKFFISECLVTSSTCLHCFHLIVSSILHI